MTFLANVLLFFVVFLPLTYLVGLPFDFFVGPNQAGDEAYPFFTWLVVVLQLVLPALLFVPIAHVGLRWLRGRHSRRALRWTAVAVLPLGFLGAHLAAWGPVVFSPQLLVLLLVPGALYGLTFRVPS